jgi:hypothetical protein
LKILFFIQPLYPAKTFSDDSQYREGQYAFSTDIAFIESITHLVYEVAWADFSPAQANQEKSPDEFSALICQ